MARTKTSTYVELPVSYTTYNEIKGKLLESDYRHAVITDLNDPERLDLSGIRLVEEKDSRRMFCYNCRHERCDDCTTTKWSMTETKGIICCQCKRPSSVEVWRSGPEAKISRKRIPVSTDQKSVK